MDDCKQFRPTWAEIDLDHLAHNIKQFKNILNKQTSIMAVVKADGYGHGAVEIANAAINAGASSLAVSLAEEAIELRVAGIKAPILVFGYTEPSLAPLYKKYRLTPTIFDLTTAKAFSEQVKNSRDPLNVHLKIDTGMNRIGISPINAVDFIITVSKLTGLFVEGIYTHFATADELDSYYFKKQQCVFNSIISNCLDKKVSIPLIHAANSAAAIIDIGAHYNMIRLGISLYGSYPLHQYRYKTLHLLPVLNLKSKIIYLKEVRAGSPIGYGCTYITKYKSLIATVPIGYADGYSRYFSNIGKVLVRGHLVPLVGRVCMDHIMIDVTNLKKVKIFDEVVIYGKQGDMQITVDEAANSIGTISYELLCSIGKRVPRVYYQNGRIAGVRVFNFTSNN